VIFNDFAFITKLLKREVSFESQSVVDRQAGQVPARDGAAEFSGAPTVKSRVSRLGLFISSGDETLPTIGLGLA